MVRSVFVPGTLGRMPRWLRWLLLGLLLLGLLWLGLLACDEADEPQSLSGLGLEGPRLVAGPVCVDEAVDVSSSMDRYTAQREHAELELFAFARRELREQDLFAEVFFASTAAAALPPTPVTQLSVAPGVPVGIDYTGTQLAPAIDALVAGRPAGADPCAARALVVITDGAVHDDPAILTSVLRTGGYTRMFVVVPVDEGLGRPDALRGDVLDSIVVYHFHDGSLSGRAVAAVSEAKPLDVIFGEIIGSLTGQRLVPTRVPTSAGTGT